MAYGGPGGPGWYPWPRLAVVAAVAALTPMLSTLARPTAPDAPLACVPRPPSWHPVSGVPTTERDEPPPPAPPLWHAPPSRVHVATAVLGCWCRGSPDRCPVGTKGTWRVSPRALQREAPRGPRWASGAASEGHRRCALLPVPPPPPPCPSLPLPSQGGTVRGRASPPELEGPQSLCQ